MSLRKRLTTSYMLLLAIALLGVGIGLYLAERTILLNGVRADLRQVAGLIQRDFEANNQPFETYFRPAGNSLIPPLRARSFTDSPIVVQIFNRDLAEVISSEQLAQALVDAEAGTQALRGVQVFAEPEVGESRLMVLAAPLRFEDRTVGVIAVAQSLATVDRALDTLILVLTSAGGLMLLGTGLLVSLVTHRGLQPLQAIARTAEQIVRAEDLSRRIPDGGQRDELGRLVAIVNDLLSRLEQLFNAQRRLVADVSHELRTPLAAMRGNLEVIRRGAARDPELLQETLGDMERETARLTRLVNDLLLLAQSEAGVEIRREPVELDTLLLEVYREIRPLANGISIMIGAEDQATTTGDRDRLKQALLNLTHNALRYTPPGGQVRLDLERSGHEVLVSVIDTGVGIPADDVPRIFDRFFRSDAARNRGSGGAGLGLAIVKWVAEAHGGTVEVSSEQGRGSVFRMRLPLARPATDQPLNAELRAAR